jgi:3-hydroxybutyryl-CoA dehydrogenase
MVDKIAVVGAGRMGRGIALSYAFSGLPSVLIDLKKRTEQERDAHIEAAIAELQQDLLFLSKVGLINEGNEIDVLSLITFSHREAHQNPLEECSIIYEGVPEVMEAKKDAFEYISNFSNDDAIVASTTSTFLVTDLALLVKNPQRFLNAHWLNPAHLMPLVEISKGDKTSQETIDYLVNSLKSIGKETVICSASAGYIVPRIQVLAMNEAARLVEEGVASAEDVDKAIKFGFGPRFAVLGLLEFIDWGGGDILYYASKYLGTTLDKRYEAPKIIVDNMENQKGGVRDGEGFFNYKNVDTNEYRQKRMQDFVALLKHRDLLPVYNQGIK